MDILAWNRLAAALICDFGALEPEQRNMLRLAFVDAAGPALYPESPRVAAESMSTCGSPGRHHDDPELAALVGELSVKSENFRRLWARRDVREKTFGRKRLDHPLVGPLELDYESLVIPSERDQLLVARTAEAGSPSQTALDLLSRWPRATLRGAPPLIRCGVSRAISSAGRAPPRQGGGHWFEPSIAH